MRKLFSLIAAVFFTGSMMATEVTFTKDDFAGQGTANTGSEVSATKDGVTFTYSKGYCADESLRCYAHGALSITAESTIEKINFTTTGGKTGGLDAEVIVGATSYEVADLASQARFTEIKVTLNGEGGDQPGGDQPGGDTPELTDPTNCAEAAEAAMSVSANNELYNNGAVYTIDGYVTEIAYAWKSGSMSFWMADAADGGNVLEAYKCAIENEADAVAVGDKVAVTGSLTKYNTTPEFAANCTVVILERAQQGGDSIVVPVDTTVVPVSGGTEVIFTKDDFAGQGTANTGSEVSATKDGVTFTCSKGYCADESLRCYAHGALSITAESTIEKINFTTTGGKTGGLDAEVIVGATSYEVADLASQARFTQIVVTLEGGEPVAVDTFTVAGAPEAIFGSYWDPTDANNDMTLANGIYKWEKAELELTAGTIEFKVVKNHDWNDGANAYPAQNYVLNIAEDGEYTITITFDPATETVAAEAVKNVPVGDPTTCAEAREAILALEDGAYLLDQAEITLQGYVTEIVTAYSDQYHNISFWMADAADGGQVIQAYRAACASAADAPNVGDKVEVTGKMKKYVKNSVATPEFDAACTFSIIEPAAPAEEYYLTGSFRNWATTAESDFHFVANPATAGEYMLNGIALAANAEIKVIGILGENVNWYPAGQGNNYVVAADGTYDIYFRPDGQGGQDWHEGYFYVAEVVPPTAISCLEVYQLVKDDVVGLLNPVTVTYSNGANVWVMDGSASMLIYLPSGFTNNFHAGDVLSGVAGIVDIYQNIVYEVKPSADQAAAIVATQGEVPAPSQAAVIEASDVNKYVILPGFSIEGEFTTASKTSLTAVLGEETVTIYNNFKFAYTFEAGKTYDIIGVVSAYKGNPQVYFISAEEATETAIDNTNIDAKVIKTIENGQLIIIKNGVRYNAQGAVVR